MSWSMFDVIPFGAGTSLCPPNYEPPCTCPPDGIDPECPVDGDGTDDEQDECKPGCNLDPADDERHQQFGGCLEDEDIAELRFKARDYEGWARL